MPLGAAARGDSDKGPETSPTEETGTEAGGENT